MNIEQSLRSYMIEERFFGQPPEDFDDDYDLIDSGVIDSLAITILISYLGEQYQIEFSATDIVPEHFSSVNALSAFVRGKLA